MRGTCRGCVLAVLIWLATSQLGHAQLVQEMIQIPVAVKDRFGKEVARDMVVTVFVEESTPKPRPILLIGHGRAPNARGRASMGRAVYSVNARWFAQLGFLVAVPTRIGYGVTGGDDVEETGDCSRKDYPPAYAAAAQQTLRALEVLRLRSDTLKDRAVIVGQSFGGATAISVAAQNPPGVQATINFAGGGGGNPETNPQNPCSPWALNQMFADYGKTARIPTLWIYTENDMYFGPRLPRQWFDAYRQSGGIGDYMLYPPVGNSGHGFFTMAPELWRPRVLEFLQAHGYPHLQIAAAAPEVQQAGASAAEPKE